MKRKKRQFPELLKHIFIHKMSDLVKTIIRRDFKTYVLQEFLEPQILIGHLEYLVAPMFLRSRRIR